MWVGCCSAEDTHDSAPDVVQRCAHRLGSRHTDRVSKPEQHSPPKAEAKPDLRSYSQRQDGPRIANPGHRNRQLIGTHRSSPHPHKRHDRRDDVRRRRRDPIGCSLSRHRRLRRQHRLCCHVSRQRVPSRRCLPGQQPEQPLDHRRDPSPTLNVNIGHRGELAVLTQCWPRTPAPTRQPRRTGAAAGPPR